MKPGQVRCVNVRSNKVAYFAKYLAENKRWQGITGFIPQVISPEVLTAMPEIQETVGDNLTGTEVKTKRGRPSKKQS